jgi:hypothetical protein
MTGNFKKAGRPPQGIRRGRPITIYLSEPRERLFEEVFELMQANGVLPSTADINRSRALIIDHALDALKAKFDDSDT